MMVAFYKHDIPTWMDGTESLDAEPYRTYHVICQLIYLAEGPIVLNEHGIAGRCKQSIRTFRAALKVLLDEGKIEIENGRISNSRAKKELGKIAENRLNASKGGQKSGEVRNNNHKPLKLNGGDEASLQEDRSLKEKRIVEESREDSSPPNGGGAPAPSLFPLQVVQEAPDARVYRRAREVLTPTGVKTKEAGRIARELIRIRNGNFALAVAAIETASTKDQPARYLYGIIRGASNDRRTEEVDYGNRL